MNVKVFETEQIPVKLPLNLRQVKELQCYCLQCSPQSLFIDTNFDG